MRSVGEATVYAVDGLGSPVVLRCEFRNTGKRVGYPAFFVRAAAMALARHPHLHAMRSGFRLIHPEHVDIALSGS